MPLVTMLGLVGNILSILVLRSPRIDMKVRMMVLLKGVWEVMVVMVVVVVVVVVKVTWEVEKETLTW